METIQKYTQDIIMQRKKKNYNVMIDGNNFFDQPVESDMRTCDNILKIATGKEDDYTTGCLLDYNYIKKDKMIAIDLSKQEGLIQNQ